MRASSALPEEVRQAAVEYVNAVAERAGIPVPGDEKPTSRASPRRSLAVALIPGVVKRFVVRGLIYLLRHPFAHLVQPVQVEVEREIGDVQRAADTIAKRVGELREELDTLNAQVSALSTRLSPVEDRHRAITSKLASLDVASTQLLARLDEVEENVAEPRASTTMEGAPLTRRAPE